MTPHIKIPVWLYDFITEKTPVVNRYTFIHEDNTIDNDSIYFYGTKVQIDYNFKTKPEAKLVAFKILSDGNWRKEWVKIAKEFLCGGS